MNQRHLSIVTMTWARDESEEALLRSSLESLARLNIPVIVTDGGSNAGFTGFLRSFPQFTVFEQKTGGLWSQIRHGLLAAYRKDVQHICYTEPDKEQFFREGLSHLISQSEMMTDDTGVLLAARSEKGFNTFPAFQRMSETTINNCCAELTGFPFDYTYGPFIFNRKLLPYLVNLPDDIGWGWRTAVFGVAGRMGCNIEVITDDYSCPVSQRDEPAAEKIYRMRQLSQSVQGVVQATMVDFNEIDSRLLFSAAK
jgi:hypothetical protein